MLSAVFTPAHLVPCAAVDTVDADLAGCLGEQRDEPAAVSSIAPETLMGLCYSGFGNEGDCQSEANQLLRSHNICSRELYVQNRSAW
jgi:hypothetical protein